jgi:hypothetical protein
MDQQPTDPGGFRQAVRERMEQAYHTRRESGLPQNVLDTDGAAAIDWAALKDAVAATRRSYALVGELPPEPPTLRGRVGGRLVQMIQRMLFWYTPQIVQFHYAVVRALEEQNGAILRLTGVVKELMVRNDELQLRYAALQQALDRERERVSRPVPE